MTPDNRFLDDLVPTANGSNPRVVVADAEAHNGTRLAMCSWSAWALRGMRGPARGGRRPRCK